jgi:Uma2 family endonuclease
MMANIYVPPPRTMMEAYQSLPEGTLAQLINNQIYMSPAPTSTHQIVLGKIFSQLLNYIEQNKLGQVLIAPLDVFLNRKNAYQPDIIFISNANLQGLKESGFYGPPDLVIEILSPATWRFDKEDKKDEFERSGVKEYWMVDPIDKSVEGFCLTSTGYQPLASTPAQLVFKLFDYTLHF